jgi:hypothetical protein
VDDIFATNATITATLTMGSGGVIKNSNTDYLINSSGIRLRGDSATLLASAEIGWYAGGGLEGAKTGSIHMIDNAAVPELIIKSGAFVDLSAETAVRVTTSGNSTGSDSGALRVTGGAYFGGDSFHAGSFTLQNSLIIGTGTNKATISYTTNTSRILTIPNVGGDRTFAFINQAQTFSANQTFTGTVTVPSLVLGSETGKATIAYTTNNARIYTIPNVSASDFVMSEGTQTINGAKTFGFGNLLLRNTGDTGSATINFGTASVNRTYTFAGAGGTVWTDGNLPITNAGPGSNTPTTRLIITLNGIQYRFDVQQL